MSGSNEGGFKNKRRTPFTMLSNALLRNPALSLQAKGLLGVMLSFPDDWQYYMKHLEGLSKSGREAHQGALKELLALGYVTRQEKRGERGRICYDYEVSDTALEQLEPPPTADGFPATVNRQRLSGNGKPATTKNDSTKKEERRKKERPRNAHFDALSAALYPDRIETADSKRVGAVAAQLKKAGWEPELITYLVPVVLQRDKWWRDKKISPDAFLKNCEVWRAKYAKNWEERPAVVTDETTPPPDDLDWTAFE